MQIHLNDLLNTDLSELKEFIVDSDDGRLFDRPCGDQHYRLLAYISTILPNGSKILEIGTRWGVSSVALSKNQNVHVTTCDIEDQASFVKRENVKFIQADGFDLLEEYKDVDLIFMDVDPHDGIQEKKMLKKLSDIDFKGILILDDIHLNKEMENFWNSIPFDKFDITQFGHYSGTGIVFFGNQSFTILQTLRK